MFVDCGQRGTYVSLVCLNLYVSEARQARGRKEDLTDLWRSKRLTVGETADKTCSDPLRNLHRLFSKHFRDCKLLGSQRRRMNDEPTSPHSRVEAALRTESRTPKVLIFGWYCAMIESFGREARLAMCLVEAVAASGVS